MISPLLFAKNWDGWEDYAREWEASSGTFEVQDGKIVLQPDDRSEEIVLSAFISQDGRFLVVTMDGTKIIYSIYNNR